MSDVFGSTHVSASAPTTTFDRTGYEPSAADRNSGESPLSNIRVEQPRRHPLTYAALILSVLALLLAIVALSRGADPVNRVQVGRNDCVSVAQSSGPAALYCRTGALPAR